MKIGRQPFNLYLATLLGLGVICGCQTDKNKTAHPLSTLRLHQEINPDTAGHSEDALVFREHPIKLTVDREPFLTEAFVKEAKVVDAVGGFALSIQFDRRGSWLLEESTAAARGRHIVIFSQFANPNEDKINQGRWLAAPKIQKSITDGLIIFTPDATREETERIALGLNNIAQKLATGKEIK